MVIFYIIKIEKSTIKRFYMAKIIFFPVGSGDMTLIKTETGKSILIDVNVRATADDSTSDTPDVMAMLKTHLNKNSDKCYYIDAFLLSHPDKDHCSGLMKHFHMGDPSSLKPADDKILINEIWSSPMVFRRASKNHTLCDDAKAFNKEAKRRVKLYKDASVYITPGNRILILGQDENGKTDDLSSIVVRVDNTFNRINGEIDNSARFRLLAPFPKGDEEDENLYSKNQSSTILQISLSEKKDDVTDNCLFITGGDAEVAIWDRIWTRNKTDVNNIRYDILQAPHHCSWHSLSYDSWSEKGDDAELSQNAYHALSQAKKGAFIVSSSNPIKDDKNNPPCIKAQRTYKDILKGHSGSFKCTMENPSESNPQPLIIDVTSYGPRINNSSTSSAASGVGAIGSQPLMHG